MARKARTPGRERRLRERFFDAGNTKCPICLMTFDRQDAVSGRKVTLEHAPPKSLGGAPICLTCESCNNKASLVDQHAYKSQRARQDWKAGRGAPIVIDLFGHKKSYRFIPRDPNSPFPARKHLFRNGSIKLESLPTKEQMDINKGITFAIPQRDDYEFVSMIKSAYLMVFSLMGANGYKYAQNIGLQPVREQIMNPHKKILKNGFVGTMQLNSEDFRKLRKPVVFLCHASNPPLWIIPMWNDKTIFLSSGAMEPIDELAVEPKETSLPNNSIVGWMASRINGSSAISGVVDNTTIDSGDTLAGAVGGPIATTRGDWLYVVAYHQGSDYVALPFCEDGHLPPSDAINIVKMLSKQEAQGQKLDTTQMAALDIGSWSKDMPITPINYC